MIDYNDKIGQKEKKEPAELATKGVLGLCEHDKCDKICGQSESASDIEDSSVSREEIEESESKVL